jgi:hypothetical protein
MQRLTWTGVAMHAGNLPGYPASHGCVRLPLDFAQMLYAVTGKGTTVIVTDGRKATETTSRPGLLLTSGTSPALASGQFMWTPEKSPQEPVSILFSSADRQAYVYRNGVEIGRAQIGGVNATFPSGSYAYAAFGGDRSGWQPPVAGTWKRERLSFAGPEDACETAHHSTEFSGAGAGGRFTRYDPHRYGPTGERSHA